MPLARTPPRVAGGGTNRAHTFSPSQAYPDGVPPSPIPTLGGGLPRTPPPGSEPRAQHRSRSSSRPKEEDDDRMDVEEPAPERRSSHAEPDHREENTGEGPPEEDEEGRNSEEGGEDQREPPSESRRRREGEEDPDLEMDVEVQAPPQTPPAQTTRAPSHPAVTPSRTPRAPRASYHPADPLSPDDPSESQPPRTPRTPRDRRLSRARTPAEVISEPPVPIRDTDEAEYGKYYETLSRALRINTIDKGLSKLTLEHMKSCYPLLAEEKPESVRDVWTNMLYQLRTDSLSGAHKLLDDYRVPKRLRTLAQVVDDASAWKETSSEGRPDAWRPDLTPFTISTGTNLEVYDQSWAELREEYLALATECGERMKAVQEKRARLANVDNGVSDSVVELAKTNKLLEGFPSAEMLDWAERAGARS